MKKPSLVTTKCIVLKVNKTVVMKTDVIPVTYCENKTALMTKWRESLFALSASLELLRTGLHIRTTGMEWL